MPEGMGPVRAAGAPRKRLAIVSSWNEKCGNASYTYALKKAFEVHYDVEVLPLDGFVLRRPGSLFNRLGKKHINAMAQRLKAFDYVNLQFEAGLYGANLHSIRRNTFALIDAAPNLILTMHRLDMVENSLLDDIYLMIKEWSLQAMIRRRMGSSYAKLYRDIILHCRKRARGKNVWIKVHTKREQRLVTEAFGFKNCIDYPICFLDCDDRESILAKVEPGVVQARYALPPDAKTIGAFGYISSYKGFETVIRAVSLLPKEWHLLVVGSQHPNSVRAWLTLDPYLEILLKEIEGGGVEEGSELPKRLQSQVRFSGRVEDMEVVRQKARALLDRVRFIGNVEDDDFTFLLRNVDATVLPYLEVGQSMSGVVALAVESGARLFCSNTMSFNEAARYYGRVYGTFDIGNYVEVAQRVQFDSTDYGAARDAAYERYNIARSVDLHRHVYERREAPAYAPAVRQVVEVTT